MSAIENQPNPCFSFTEREQLNTEVSHDRFMSILMKNDIDVHEVSKVKNDRGECLFVTVSCRAEQPKKIYTFWGMGYQFIWGKKEWMFDNWQWYQSLRKPDKLPTLIKEKAFSQIEEQEAFVKASAIDGEESYQAENQKGLFESDEYDTLYGSDDPNTLGWALLGHDD